MTVREIAERVLARASEEQRALDEAFALGAPDEVLAGGIAYEQDVIDPEKVALARYALEAEKTLREIAEWPWGEPDGTLEESWIAIRDHARVFLAEHEPVAQPTRERTK